MSIRLQCTCGNFVQARAEDAGHRAVCPACAQANAVPDRPVPPVAALPEVGDDPPIEAKLFFCRLCRQPFASNDVYDADGVYTCRFCYQKEASAPIKSSRKQRKKETEPNPYHMDNHLATSLVVAGLSFLFCIPLGLIPLYYSMQIDNLLTDGELAEAQDYEECARWWNNVCFAYMGVGAVIYALLAVCFFILA